MQTNEKDERAEYLLRAQELRETALSLSHDKREVAILITMALEYERLAAEQPNAAPPTS